MSSERGAELLVACAASVGRAKSAAGPQCTAATATCWGISSAPRRRHTSWRTYQHWPGETIPQLHGWLDSATLHLVYSYFAGGRDIDPLEFRGSYSFFSYCVVLCHSLFYFLYCIFLCLLPKWQINLFIYSATSNNMKLVHWSLMGGLLHLVQRGGNWVGPQPAPPRCTKCNSSFINGQRTNHHFFISGFGI